jgi:peptide/nickel transport system substrate-binding protein
MMLSDRAGTVNPALKEVKVRQAINHAFDKDALLNAVAKGRGTVTTQVFPVGSEAYDPALDSRYPYDPAKAKSLLAEAGYPNGFTLDMPRSTAVGSAMWTLLAQQLKDVGITVNYTDVGNQYIADILAKKYAANWFQLQQDTPWQVITFEILKTATWNNFKFEDPQAEKLAQQYHDAVETSDPNAGAIAKELNKYIVEQAWFAPWFRIESNYATDKNTNVAAQRGNAYPYLSSFTPKS